MAPLFEHKHTERAILTCVLKNPDLLIELSSKLSLNAFTYPLHRKILGVLIEFYNAGYTSFEHEYIYQSISLILGEGDAITSSELEGYLRALFNGEANTANFAKYLDDLLNIHIKNQLYDSLRLGLDSLKNDTTKSALRIAADIQSSLYSIDLKSDHGDDPINVSEDLERRLQRTIEDPTGGMGIPTGLPELDEIIRGFLPNKFYFVAARPGEGKSAMLLQFAAHAAYFTKINRVPILFMDTEIKTDEFEDRLLGHAAGVDHRKITSGEWYNDDFIRPNVLKAKDYMKKAGVIYHKYVPGYNPTMIVNTMRKYIYNYGVGVIFFDYLKEPEDEHDLERWRAVGRVARLFKDHVAGKFNVPVVSALQQNRKGDQKSRVSSDSFADSDDVFKEADGAFALNEKTPDEIKKETLKAGTHRFQIIKGRYTRKLLSGLNLNFTGYCLRFRVAEVQNVMELNDHGLSDNNAESPLFETETKELPKTDGQLFQH